MQIGLTHGPWEVHVLKSEQLVCFQHFCVVFLILASHILSQAYLLLNSWHLHSLWGNSVWGSWALKSFSKLCHSAFDCSTIYIWAFGLPYLLISLDILPSGGKGPPVSSGSSANAITSGGATRLPQNSSALNRITAMLRTEVLAQNRSAQQNSSDLQRSVPLMCNPHICSQFLQYELIQGGSC